MLQEESSTAVYLVFDIEVGGKFKNR